MGKLPETILLYSFKDQAKIHRMEAVLAKLRIQIKILPLEAWREKIGYLLGLSGFSATKLADDNDFSFPHEVMIFYNIKKKRLADILHALAKAQVSNVTYKAMVTPFNTFWSLKRLCFSMQKEHALFLKQQENKDE